METSGVVSVMTSVSSSPLSAASGRTIGRSQSGSTRGGASVTNVVGRREVTFLHSTTTAMALSTAAAMKGEDEAVIAPISTSTAAITNAIETRETTPPIPTLLHPVNVRPVNASKRAPY